MLSISLVLISISLPSSLSLGYFFFTDIKLGIVYKKRETNGSDSNDNPRLLAYFNISGNVTPFPRTCVYVCKTSNRNSALEIVQDSADSHLATRSRWPLARSHVRSFARATSMSCNSRRSIPDTRPRANERDFCLKILSPRIEQQARAH